MGPPAELMREIASACAVEIFVETGTYEGYTAAWAAENFRRVLTIELSEHFHRQARERFQSSEKTKNIEFIFGDSRTQLARIIEELERPAIFWLDAHWSGGATYGDDDQCPLIEELRVIRRSKFDNFIFIDDARLFTSPPPPPHLPEQWSGIAAIIETLRGEKSDCYIVIVEDVIIAVPPSARKIVERYCQKVNAEIWEDYSRRQLEKKSAGEKSGGLIARFKKPAGEIYRLIVKNGGVE